MLHTTVMRRQIGVADMAIIGAIVLIVAVVLFPVIARAREASRTASELTAYRATSLAQSLYLADYDGDNDLRPEGIHYRRGLGYGGRAGRHKSGNGISYHGGPLILGTTKAYYIWYGGWSGNTATNILTDFGNNIGGSPYFNINTTYYDGSNTHVSNAVSLAGQYTTSAYLGSSLSDAQIQQIVSDAINGGHLPKDTNAVYFVLTSADINESSGFCTQYCGWHTHGTIAGSDIKYSFVGNPDRCPSGCEAQTTSPNGNAGADGMASIIAHELEEAVTDPDLNAWYDTRGAENADKCAWTFGTTYTVSNGSSANMQLGSRDYLIQQNWVNAGGGYCALSY